VAKLVPLPLTASCFSKIQIGLPFWYRLTRVVPDKGPLNECVCVCVCVFSVGHGACRRPHCRSGTVVRTITEDSESLDDDDDRQVTDPARPSGSALTHLPGADPTQPPPTANRGACIKLCHYLQLLCWPPS